MENQLPDGVKDIQSDQVEAAKRKSDIEWQKLEIDKERLKLDMKKERTAKLQTLFPIVIGLAAILSSSYTLILQTNYTANRAEQETNLSIRLELFKKLTQHTSDPEEIRRIFKEMFGYNEVYGKPLGNGAKSSPTPYPSPTRTN